MPPDFRTRQRAPSALLHMLAEDSVSLPPTDDRLVSIACFAGTHPSPDDQPLPLWIDTTSGRYGCQSCGIQGDAFTYLLDQRRYGRRRARRRLEQYSWPDKRIRLSENAYFERLRSQDTPPHYDEISPGNSQARQWPLVAAYDYRDFHGRLVSRVTRWSRFPHFPLTTVHYFREWTPAHEQGGWWLSDPVNPALPAEDRAGRRPLYHLGRDLAIADGARAIWVVPTEQSVDALWSMAPEDSRIAFSTVCRSLRQARFNDMDLEPLRGKTVWLVADQRSDSRRQMADLAVLLRDEFQAQAILSAPAGRGNYLLHRALHLGWDTINSFVHGNAKRI